MIPDDSEVASLEAKLEGAVEALEAIRDDPNPEAGWRIAAQALVAMGVRPSTDRGQ